MSKIKDMFLEETEQRHRELEIEADAQYQALLEEAVNEDLTYFEN